MTREADIVQRGAHWFWCCPNCQRTMGELLGTRLLVIISRDRMASFPLVDALHLNCPKCGQVSTCPPAVTHPPAPA